MKKVLSLILAVLMMVGAVAAFASCKKSNEDAAEEKVITVGYTIYAPMNYEDENGKLIGFDTELAEKVFGNLGYKVNFQVIKWENKYLDLKSGTIDCIWNGFTVNSTDKNDAGESVPRSSLVDFSYTYMENRQVVVVKNGSGINGVEDLKGKVGAVEAGSAGETYAEDEFATDEVGAVISSVLKQTDALLEVKSGSADFAVLDVQLANSYCGKGDYADLSIVDSISGETEFYAVGFKKGSNLTAKVNEQLDALAKSGELLTLAKKYKLENSVITDFSK